MFYSDLSINVLAWVNISKETDKRDLRMFLMRHSKGVSERKARYKDGNGYGNRKELLCFLFKKMPCICFIGGVGFVSLEKRDKHCRSRQQ